MQEGGECHTVAMKEGVNNAWGVGNIIQFVKTT